MSPQDLDTAARGEELLQLLSAIGWNQGTLAARLNLHPDRTRRWAHGHNRAPDRVLAWLRDLAAYHAAHSLPDDWDA